MAITLTCPNCAQRSAVNEDRAGTQVRCPHCSAVITVPMPAASATLSPATVENENYRPRGREPSDFLDFLLFRRLVVPILIQVFFWIAVALCVLMTLILFSMADARRGRDGGILGVIAFLNLFLGPIVVRIWCELLIVIFRINETLTDIKNELQRRS